ncbi:MAG: FecR family protein [Acidobacteria bacterium]|nr:FecR family protein [Acidobacteriota bacterium]
MNEQNLDQILDEIRQQDVSAAELKTAQDRVWAKLATPPACAEFRADYGKTDLTEARRFLLDDHLTRCVECRRVLTSPSSAKANVIAMPVKPARRFTVPKWAIAAGVAAVALVAGRDRLDSLLAPSGPRATVEAISGAAYGMGGEALAAGVALGEGQVIRTGRGTRSTLKLADGSTVEVNESSELSVKAAWSGQSIYLERGDVIVHAAKQRRGGLRVVTRDSVATVRGTIFTVSTGTAGSLVGVMEGSVAVNQPNHADQLLKPGERSATSVTLERVSLKEAVSWSPNADQYYGLLAELAAIEKKLVAPAARTQARLVAALPLDPIVYGALPNLGPTLTQAVSLIEQRSNQSAVLKDWWQSSQATEMKQMVERVRTLSPLLGDELVFVLTKSRIPLVLAEVKPGQQEAVKAALDPMETMPYAFASGLLVLSDSPADLATVLPQLGKGSLTPFAAEVARHYLQGVTSLFGVDLAAFPQQAVAGEARYLFFDQRADDNEISLAFAGPRTGIASWLATPAAASSAEYVSSDAVFAFSAATRNPRQIFDELTAQIGRWNPSWIEGLRKAEAETGVQFSTDLAAALGTDFTFAVETPTLPIPGWILAIEAYRPETYTATMRRLVDTYNRRPGATPLTMQQEKVNGVDWYSLQIAGQSIQLHWTFDRGYLVQGGDRAVVQRAVATRSGGFPLVRSAKYRAQQPSASGLHQSGFLWINVGDAFGNLAGLVENPSYRKLLENREPSLLTFTGETERIRSASRTRISSLLLDMFLTQGPTKL